MTKVLIITRSFVREVTTFVDALARTGQPFDFTVIVPETAAIPSEIAATILPRKLYWSSRMRAACYSPKIFQDIQACQPDILHVFEEFSGLIAFQSILCHQLLRQQGRIMVYSAENIPGNIRSVLRLPMQYVRQRADLAFVCSELVKDVLQEEGFTHPIEVFPLGVEHTRFYKFPVDQLKTQLELDGKFVLGYVGRLLEMKGIFTLIEMMRALPENVHLLMIGTGPEEHNLRQAIATARLEQRVHLPGNIPYQRLPHYLNCLDLGIVPSKTTPRWQEQFGRVLVELMGCEVPVIGSDSGSIPEVVGAAGCIFPENDVQALVHIVNTLAAQPETRQRLGKIGRRRVETLYSMEIMCQKLLAMYCALLPDATREIAAL